jgi:hypothetical protein
VFGVAENDSIEAGGVLEPTATAVEIGPLEPPGPVQVNV